MKSSFFSLKSSCKCVLSSIAVLGALGASHAFAEPVSDDANTSATVVEPIAIVKDQDLDFSNFSAGTGGTIVLTTAGAASATGDVVITSGTSAAAEFTVTGETDASFSIGISNTVLTHSEGAETMALATTHDVDGSAQDDPATGTLAAGTQTLYVGGILTVASAQLAGSYTGTITATVDYN